MTNSVILNIYGPLFSFPLLVGFIKCEERLSYPYLSLLYLGLVFLYLSSDYIDGRKEFLSLGFMAFSLSFMFYFGGYYKIFMLMSLGLLFMLYSNTDDFSNPISQYKILSVFVYLFSVFFLINHNKLKSFGLFLALISLSVYLCNYRNLT